jgi:hypothetical protein
MLAMCGVTCERDQENLAPWTFALDLRSKPLVLMSNFGGPGSQSRGPQITSGGLPNNRGEPKPSDYKSAIFYKIEYYLRSCIIGYSFSSSVKRGWIHYSAEQKLK